MAINVLLVDDDELIRSSLSIILDMDQDIKVIDTCINGDDAYEKVISGLPIDVILMDIRMPVCDGVLATKKIANLKPEIKIIILTTFDDDEYIFEALKNGARGYLLKNVSPQKIIEAIKVVNTGSMLVHPDIADKLSHMLHKEKGLNLETYGLSKSEIDIIKHIADGYTNKEISDKIYLSEGTIKNKIPEILTTLDLRDRTQIAIFYLKDGKL